MPPNVALMHLLLSAANENEAREALDLEIENAAPRSRARLDRMLRMWKRVPAAFDTVRRMNAAAEAGTDDWARAFDEAVRISPEAAVALYSFGDAVLLDAITRELVACVQAWQLLHPADCVLDLGCGTGRVAVAVAPCVSRVIGTEVSGEMAKVARERTAIRNNIMVLQGGGENLAFLASGAFDLVLAIDSFPYLVQCGRARDHIAETARVLKAEGRLLIMNYSYRGDLARDCMELASLAREHGLEMLRNGTSDLSLWDGRAFLLRKREAPCRARF